MSSENKEQFRLKYQAGKAAFERGDYRASVKYLVQAIALVNRNSPIGGETQIWLVTAYEAAGQKEEAVALCQQLSKHPDLETRKQGKNLLYILQAPQLKRPAEWMTTIPDLAEIAESDPAYRRGSCTFTSSNPKTKQKLEPEPLDPSQINNKDNKFVWVSLIVLGLTLGGLIWFGT
ncbi:MAG: tetratricopeptide repeat protein [Coleofasciculaceae cyanobacterium]